MDITSSQKKEFQTAYQECVETLIKDVLDYRRTMLRVLSEHDFQCEFNFSDFARESFLHNIKAFHDHYYSLESATQSFKEIINKRK